MGVGTWRPAAEIQKRLESDSGGGEVLRFWVRPQGRAGGGCGPLDVRHEGGTGVNSDLGFALSYWRKTAGNKRLGDSLGTGVTLSGWSCTCLGC